VRRADPTLALTAPPALADPVGSLDHPLRRDIDVGGDGSFAVAGRRACVTGGAARGVDQVRVHPHRLAAGPRLVDAVCEEAILTPLGLERRLRVDGGTVIERVVVPRDAPFALFEWQVEDEAGEQARAQRVTVALEWMVEPDPDGPGSPPRWQRGPRLLATTGSTGMAAFVFSHDPAALTPHGVEGDGPEGNGPAHLRFRAIVEVHPGHGLRLAMAGAADAATLDRALRAANRTRAVVQARRGVVARLLEDRLSLDSPDPVLDRAVADAKVALEDRAVDTPGMGRTLVAGYGPDAPAYDVAAALQGARDALLTGDFHAARDVLFSLGQQVSVGSGEPDATLPYLALAGDYHAWTGDTATVGTEWPRLMAAWDRVRGLADAGVVDGLVRMAEALGERAVAQAVASRHGRARGQAVGPAEGGEGVGLTALARVRRLLGVEPDAVRGRLTLRPRPPSEWEHFQVRGLSMGDAAFALAYRRTGAVHRFTLRQDRGPVPATLILELEIPGPLRAARVDGVAAQLAAVAVEAGAWRVPVQLALDHERVVELEVAKRG
jgi:hypothetical protein